MQQFCLHKCLAQFVSKNGSAFSHAHTHTHTCRKNKHVQATRSCSIHQDLLLYTTSTMKTAQMQSKESERITSKTTTEIDRWINRLIRARQRRGLRSGQRLVWRDWWHWINGKTERRSRGWQHGGLIGCLSLSIILYLNWLLPNRRGWPI